MSIDALTDVVGKDLNASIGPNDLRQSFVGKANTIETGSLVSRLQNYTADGGPNGHINMSLMNGGAHHLLHKIVAMLRKHDMDVQLLNGIRYECMRQDRMRKQFPHVPKMIFMSVFKQYNLNLGIEDSDNLLNFLRIDAPKNYFNLRNMDKLFEIMCRMSFKTQRDGMRSDKDGKIRAPTDS
jgi:hypothetical protein